MTHLAAYEQQLAADLKHREREDLRKVLATAEGRRFTWAILSACGVYQRTFTGDALSTVRNEGRREPGIELLERIEAHAPGSYLTMMKENLDEQAVIEAGRRNAEALDLQDPEGGTNV